MPAEDFLVFVEPIDRADRPMTQPLFRKPQRVSIALPYKIYRQLIGLSVREGHSIANLAAFLLQAAAADAAAVDRDVLGHDISRLREPPRKCA